MGLLQKRLCRVILLTLFITLVCVSINQAKEDPELRQCKHQCRHQEQFDEPEKLGCERSCEEYIIEKEKRKSDDSEKKRNDLNPYVYKYEEFSTQSRRTEGSTSVLPMFTERSKLLKGIENYRVALFESSPRTFVVPSHGDDDVILFVALGRGAMTLVFTNRRESYNIVQGHVMVVPAGAIVYLINRDENQKIKIAILIHPLSNPGSFDAYFSGASQNVESYFNGFSTDVFEAAFETSNDVLRRIFSPKTDEGVIKTASKEQIRALSHGDNTLSPFIRGKISVGFSPVNLFGLRPKESNEFGKLVGIDTSENKVLRELGVSVYFANITQGSMHAIYYNSRATKIGVVVNGRGKLEMSCPHIAKSGDQQRHHDSRRSKQWDKSDTGRSREWEASETPIHYSKVSSELKPGTVFIVPPGHPYVTIASQNDNLQIFCFELNAENNQKFPLAGKKNILKNIEKEAKKLTYGSTADEVDSVFNNTNEDFFFRGPSQHRRHHDLTNNWIFEAVLSGV